MGIISGSAPGGTTSISRVALSRPGRSSSSGGSAGSMDEGEEGKDGDAGCGAKRGESVTIPILIVGGKMKKGD